MSKLTARWVPGMCLLAIAAVCTGGTVLVTKANDHKGFPEIVGKTYVLTARVGEAPADRMICLDLKVGRSGQPSSSYRHCYRIETAVPFTVSIAMECDKPYTTHLFGFVDSDVARLDMSFRYRKAISVRPVDLRFKDLSMYVIDIPGRIIPRAIEAKSGRDELVTKRKFSRWERPSCRGGRGGTFYGTLTD